MAYSRQDQSRQKEQTNRNREYTADMWRTGTDGSSANPRVSRTEGSSANTRLSRTEDSSANTRLSRTEDSSTHERMSEAAEGSARDRDPVEELRSIFSGLEGVELNRRHGAKLRFRFYLTPSMAETNIEALELSVRAYNSLKRAGYSQIGKLAEDVAGDEDILHRIRNCGRKTAEEIKIRLFIFQYDSLKPEKREAYLRETLSLNMPQNV